MSVNESHSRLVWFGFALSLACSRELPTPAGDASETVPATSGSVASKPVSRTGQARAARGGSLFDFPKGALSARPGGYALVPSRNSLDAAFERDAEQRMFVYLGAFLEELGESESGVRWLTQQRGWVPNVLMVPIRSGERATPGDILLTSWASGSGLQRAIVVSGGSPESPKVRYLDLSMNPPTAFAGPDDVLPPNTFHVLREPGEVGSSAACALPESERTERLVVIQRTAEKLLGLGFAGRMRVVELSRCVFLPLAPKLRVGDTVHVPAVGGFVEARVTKLDGTVGRVFVRHAFASDDTETAVGFTNVATELPAQ